MDVHSPLTRSFNMSKIKGKDTRPEMIVRHWLWRSGYRYRLHRKDLPGKPDIVLRKYDAVVFVHGCFWHRHGCRATTTPATRREFWLEKFEENVIRDKHDIESLMKLGWRVMIIWECNIQGKNADLDSVAKQIADFLRADTKFLETTTSQVESGNMLSIRV